MRWFSSDWHLYHDNILDFCDRPYGDIHHMAVGLAANYMKAVAPDDDVYFLGDMFMGNLEAGLEVASYLPGNKFLVPGNHDKVWRARAKWEKFLPLYEEAGITVLPGQHVINIGDEPVMLCHFPYFGVDKEHGHNDKYSGSRPDDEGGWLICGHVHQAWTVKDRMINVGVDVHDYSPVSEDWILEVITAATR